MIPVSIIAFLRMSVPMIAFSHAITTNFLSLLASTLAFKPFVIVGATFGRFVAITDVVKTSAFAISFMTLSSCVMVEYAST